MGIPRFFAFLSTSFRHLINDVLKLPNNSHIEGIYIDLNSVIHEIAQVTFKYGLDRELTQDDLNLQQLFRNISGTNQEEIQKIQFRRSILFKNIGLYLSYAYRFAAHISPISIFMMAADGVAPKAKMVQQRMRRYKSSKPPVDFFDPIMISPGTEFMDALDNYLKIDWIKIYGESLPGNPLIIYSGHREPGEGEHKIFQQMNANTTRMRRKLSKGNRSTPYQLVLGADSDLIILSMSRSNNIIFMKKKQLEDKNKMDLLEQATMNPPCNINQMEQAKYINNAWSKMFKEGFIFADVTQIKEGILDQYLEPNDILDFTVISFFVGNDFLPPLAEFHSVSSLSPMYFLDSDIEDTYRKIFEHTFQKDVNAKPGERRKIKYDKKKEPKRQFNRILFWKQFKEKEETWMQNDKINYNEASGIWNKHKRRYEIYPLITDETTGNKQRMLLFKMETGKKWITPKEDIGALKLSLLIYRNLMWNSRKFQSGRSNSFLVEEKEKINYVNLYSFMKELVLFLKSFMESEAAHNKHLKNKNREASNIIDLSIGINETKNKGNPVYVASTYSVLNRMKSFAIYDSEHSDINLPKQAVDERCRKWIEGIQWTLRYYSIGLHSINTKWFYTFRDGPSILELVDYLDRRIKVSVPGIPGIRISSNTVTEVEIERVKYSNGIINIYYDSRGHKIGQIKTSDSQVKFIDLNYIEFFKENPSQQDLIRLRDQGKFPILELKRNIIKLKVKYVFSQNTEILELVSNNTIYASTVESFFNIMPIHILKQILTSELVDNVILKIADAFPDSFEMLTEGTFYDSQSEPKIPFLSSVRVERAVNDLDSKFDVEIKRFNKTQPRFIILYKNRVVPIVKALNIPYGK